MSKKILIYIILILMIGGLATAIFYRAPKPAQTLDPADRPTVITSFYPLYFLAKTIGGQRATVINLTPAGAEPHDYELTAQDIAQIETSRLLIINGSGLEAWGQKIKDNISARTDIIVVSDGLTDKALADGKDQPDPHIWLDPALAQKIADKITLGLIAADPQNQDYYQANSAMLKSKLADLDNAYRTGLSNCKNKDIITAHTAFAYLARAYGLRQVSITGLAPEAEASPRQMVEISKFAKDKKINYIFFESLVSPKLAQTIAEEIGAQTLVLNPLEGLSDSDLAAGRDYLSEMQNNLNNLKIALKCQ